MFNRTAPELDRSQPLAYFTRNDPRENCERQYTIYDWGGEYALVDYSTGETLDTVQLVWSGPDQ